jgi:hypothetical protein
MAAGELLYHQSSAQVRKMAAKIRLKPGEVQFLTLADRLGAVLQAVGNVKGIYAFC